MNQTNKKTTLNLLEDFRPLKDFEEQIENSFKRREELLSTISKKNKKKLSIVRNDSQVIDESKLTNPIRTKSMA
jgi:hypothetical protein